MEFGLTWIIKKPISFLTLEQTSRILLLSFYWEPRTSDNHDNWVVQELVQDRHVLLAFETLPLQQVDRRAQMTNSYCQDVHSRVHTRNFVVVCYSVGLYFASPWHTNPCAWKTAFLRKLSRISGRDWYPFLKVLGCLGHRPLHARKLWSVPSLALNSDKTPAILLTQRSLIEHDIMVQ